MSSRTKLAVQWLGSLVLASALSGTIAYAQTSAPVKDDLFAGTEKFSAGASDVTEVTMDPETLAMVGGKDSGKARNMVLNVVRTYEYPKPGMYNIADVEAIRARLNTGDWRCTVHTQELKSGESTDICYKHRTDGLVEQAIITVEPKELTFIHTIRRPGSSENGGGPEVGDLPMISPEFGGSMTAVGAEMAALGPMLQAQMAVISPELRAQMAAVGPQIKARMAELGPQLQRSLPGVQIDTQELDKELREQMQRQLNAPPQPPQPPSPPQP